MELKQGHGEHDSIIGKLLIEPVWNWGFLHKPTKRCIKGIKRLEHTPLWDEQWYLCWSVLPFVYEPITASEPEANRHVSQKAHFLIMSISVSH